MKFRNHLAILTLMILGMTIMVNQVTQPVAIVKSAVESSSEDSETSTSDEQTYVLQANLVVSSITQVTPHQEFYQIREIVLNEVLDSYPEHHTPYIAGTSHFRTLFRKVISTNAP